LDLPSSRSEITPALRSVLKQATLDGFHAALYVSVGAALLGVTAMLQRAPRPVLEVAFDDEVLEEAA